jgi:transcription elongation GreA/GreB family factor
MPGRNLKEILDYRDAIQAMGEREAKMVGRPEEISVASIFTRGIVQDSGFIFGSSVWGVDSFDDAKPSDAVLYGL